MWRSIEKNYKLIVLSLIGCSILLLITRCDSQDTGSNNIFETIESIDYSNVEAPVVEKIGELLEKTKMDPDSVELWGKLAMNLYIHGYKTASVPVFKKLRLWMKKISAGRISARWH